MVSLVVGRPGPSRPGCDAQAIAPNSIASTIAFAGAPGSLRLPGKEAIPTFLD